MKPCDDDDDADTDISCEQFIRTLADYLAGELRGEDRKQSELHVAVCPDCVRYLRDYEVTIRLGKASMRGGGGPSPESGLPQGLAQVILAGRKRET